MIPSAADYLELHNLLRQKQRTGLARETEEIVRLFASGNETLDHFQRFLKAIESAQQQEIGAAARLRAYRWLDSQPGVRQALTSMRRSQKRRWARRPQPQDEWPWSKFKELIALKDEPIAWRAAELERFLVFLRDMVASPMGGLSVAYLLYFHTDRPRELRAAYAAQQKTQRGIAIATAALSEQLEGVAYRAGPWESVSDAAQRAMSHLDRAAAALTTRRLFERVLIAVERKDQWAKERVLVHDLANQLLQAGWAAGPSALSDLLTVDGIKNRLDLRTIERLVARRREVTRQIQREHKPILVGTKKGA